MRNRLSLGQGILAVGCAKGDGACGGKGRHINGISQPGEAENHAEAQSCEQLSSEGKGRGFNHRDWYLFVHYNERAGQRVHSCVRDPTLSKRGQSSTYMSMYSTHISMQGLLLRLTVRLAG